MIVNPNEIDREKGRELYAEGVFDWFEMSPVEQETLLPRDSISAESPVSARVKGSYRHYG